jgi:hypothetical protein
MDGGLVFVPLFSVEPLQQEGKVGDFTAQVCNNASMWKSFDVHERRG